MSPQVARDLESTFGMERANVSKYIYNQIVILIHLILDFARKRRLKSQYVSKSTHRHQLQQSLHPVDLMIHPQGHP
jgi:hypothetical protein